MKLNLFAFSTIAILRFSSVQSQELYLHWIKTFNGKGNMTCYDISISKAGDIYTTGTFTDTIDFDPGSGVYNVTSSDALYGDLFISRLTASGQFANAWAIGGIVSQDVGTALVTDAGNNIFVTGYFHGTADFKPGPDSTKLTAAGQSDPFIAKYNTSDQLVWVKRQGSGSRESNSDIARDTSGNLFTTGIWQNDLYLYKTNPQGDTMWTRRYAPTKLLNTGNAICTDASGNVYITGYYWGLDLLPTIGNEDVFIMKFDTDGNLLWAKGFGGTGRDFGNAITIDATGNIYTAGIFSSKVDFNPSTLATDTFFMTSAGGSDVFIMKLDNAGNFVWARRAGGKLTDGLSIVELDESNNLLISGTYTGAAVFDTTHLMALGKTDVFISRINSNGNFIWTKTIGGRGTDGAGGLEVDAKGNVFLTGYFSDTADLEPGIGVSNHISGGFFDVFVAKLGKEKSTSIEEPRTHSSIICYPNPSGDVLHVNHGVSGDIIRLETMDMKGKTISEYGRGIFNGQNFSIPTDMLHPGIYVINIYMQDGTKLISRFIKE